ncbi:hypothetical protein [Streptomyces sp. f150]|uniref:hypothetical protein n=1 Tax=Streptomyces sp. f150 TaxID=1827699 RepID=UPI000BF13472|nr:hypothetical protein [Streptomyces sp. f150]
MTTTSSNGHFHKILPEGRAEAEESGWLQVAERLQVAALLERTRLNAHTEVITYEDVFASGRCRYLLGDLISLADYGRIPTSKITAVVDAVCDTFITTYTATGRISALSACVPALYTDRIRPGRRVDSWYLNPNLTITDTRTGERVPLATLTDYTTSVNGIPLPLDLPAAIDNARTSLHPDSRWSSAVTQGDPTEPNLATSADGVCWLDFEHAGRNTLAGEIANFLWYLLALGGWLVPRYQPDVYARTLRLCLPPQCVPAVRAAELSTRGRELNLDYTWPTGRGRWAALTQLSARIAADLGDAAGLPRGRQLHALRPFLTLRILGVIPPHLLTPDDLLLIMAKLAEAQHLECAPFIHTTPLAAITPMSVEVP